MKIEELDAYELAEKRTIKELKSEGCLLSHKKTGARVMLMSNDDDNKVFYIGFRTPPKDSTGVAHILEHSVLCGSANFPAKDPFVELAKGSLNTFLNAMTYPDKTIYPVASCNDKDFQNLLHVYLDAVFFPNIYKEEKIFRQEGWHYDMEDIADELSINGVVYNEMKGVFSSPDDVLEQEVLNSLFPNTTYGYNSGGDPDEIPALTYENFLAFHKEYYHPSNSYIYLYGNADMAEKLDWIDKEYLSKFDRIEVDSKIEIQKPFSKQTYAEKEYSITDGESEDDASYLAYSAVVGTSLDKELYIVLQILDYALCSASGAPLKQALIDKGIGTDVFSTIENGIMQPYFSIVSKNTDPQKKDEFINTINEVIERIIKDGFDKKSLKAAINYYEFRHREADFGAYPKGLMYGLQALESWLYDDNKPFLHMEANETFAVLKSRADEGYYEALLKEYLIENPHKSLVVVKPVKGLTARREKEFADKLRGYRDSLTESELKQIVDKTEALIAYQEEPSAKEDLEKIPLLKRSDIKKEAEPLINELHEIKDVKALFHPIFTNGISYVKLVFDVSGVSKELVPYIGLLKAVLGFVDTENYSYADLFNEINIRTGGLSAGFNTYTDACDVNIFTPMFEIKVKALYENLPDAFELLKEVMFASKFSDTKRLYEIVAERKSRMQAAMISSGHAVAAMRAMAYFSKNSAYTELMSGVPFYRFLEDLENDFEAKKDDLVKNLQLLTDEIFRTENLLLDYTADRDSYEAFEGLAKEFTAKLRTGEKKNAVLNQSLSKRNEGFTTSAQVQYVCGAGNFRTHGFSYTGALRVLKVILGYEYLWNRVRVKGGAYGCMNLFSRSGDSYFVSYRDPNLGKTLDAYRGAVDFLKEFSADERNMTKFVIGAVSDLDTPLPPAAKGGRSLAAYIARLEYDEIQKERDEVLAADESVIREMSKLVEAVLSDNYICVVGNEEKINENKGLFLSVENLFH